VPAHHRAYTEKIIVYCMAKGAPMIARLIRIATLLVFPLALLNACAAQAFLTGLCSTPLRAILAEFPQYGNVSVAPEQSSTYGRMYGCVLAYSTTDSPEQVLAYFTEQFEAHGWSGVPFFSAGEDEIIAHRDSLAYAVQIFDDVYIDGQPLPSGSSWIEVSLRDLSATKIDGYEPNADFPKVELSEEELEKFTGEFDDYGRVEAVLTIVDGQLQLRRPGRLANSLIPVGPTRFRIKDFSDAFLVEFEMADGKVKSMTILQDTTGFHIINGSMRERLTLVPLQ
jgi:hypothetical protein